MPSPERQPQALHSVLDLSLARTNAGLGFHSQSTDNAPFVDDDLGRLVTIRPASVLSAQSQSTDNAPFVNDDFGRLVL